MIKFDPTNAYSMLYWVANNATDDPSWRDCEEWRAINDWRIKQYYGMYVRAIDHLPNVFDYATNEQSPLKHMTTDQLRLLETWYKEYIVPIKNHDD